MKIERIPKQVVLLGLVSLFTDVASEMLYPITPIFLTAVLGSSMAVVGIIEGAAEITAGFLKGYFGKLSDKIGKRSIFVYLGYGLSAVSKPLPGIFPFISTVVVSRISDRIGKGVRTAPRDALLASYSNNNTGTIFGFHRGMDTLGAAIGPVGALLLLQIFPENYALIFLIAFIPSLIAVAFSLTIKDKPLEIPRKKVSKISYKVFWKEAPSSYKILLVLFTTFSFVNSSDVFLILKSRDISHSSSLAILGYVFYNLVYAGVSYPIGKLSDKVGKKKILIAGLLIYSAVYLGFAVLPKFVFLWPLFALYGIYAASTEGIAKAWVSDLIIDNYRGSAIGLLTMFSSLAIMFGSFAAGILWDKFGSAVPFLLSSAISFLVAFAFIFYKSSR